MIDALLVSAGVNDLGFGEIIHRCAMDSTPGASASACVDKRTSQELSAGISHLQEKLDHLPDEYNALAAALRSKLPGTREVYLTDYPADIFRGGACGNLHFNGVGISAGEGEQIRIWGERLNRKISEATTRFRNDPDRWNKVDPLSVPFTGHHYCSGGFIPLVGVSRSSWFVSNETSWRAQGNEKGTAHPNADGHEAIAKLIRKSVVPEQSARPYWHLTVTIEAVRVAPLPGGPTRSIDITLWKGQELNARLTRLVDVTLNGQWTPVPPAIGTFNLDVYTAPASPRHAIALKMILRGDLPIRHNRNDGYGVGTHIVRHPTGTFEVRYKVAAEAPPSDAVATLENQ
jgi:hypothetical protein